MMRQYSRGAGRGDSAGGTASNVEVMAEAVDACARRGETGATTTPYSPGAACAGDHSENSRSFEFHEAPTDRVPRPTKLPAPSTTARGGLLNLTADIDHKATN